MGDAANNEGRTVLYVSHNMNTIRQLCTRCIVLDHGRLVFDGKPDDAISVYMSRQTLQNDTDVDLSQLRMSHIPEDAPVKMMHFRLLDSQDAWYRAGEPIRFRLRIKARARIRDLRFRLELRYIDDSPVGVSLCPSLGEWQAGEERSVELSMDSTLLTGGKYKCLFVLYSVNEYGAYQDHDAIFPVFCFEIEELADIVWRGYMWGRIRLPELTLSHGQE